MEKVKITSDNISDYYSLINDKLDAYFKFHISPKSLLKYFSNSENLENFKQKNSIENIENINLVIQDVLKDRHNILTESIQTFDMFKDVSNIDIIFNGTKGGDIKIQTILADFFEVPLSKISMKSVDKNIYIVNSNEYYCFDQDNLLKIKNNIIDFIINELKKQRLTIDFLKMDFSLNEFIEEYTFKKTLDNIINNNHITQFLSLTDICKYVGTHKNCVVWSKK